MGEFSISYKVAYIVFAQGPSIELVALIHHQVLWQDLALAWLQADISNNMFRFYCTTHKLSYSCWEWCQATYILLYIRLAFYIIFKRKTNVGSLTFRRHPAIIFKRAIYFKFCIQGISIKIVECLLFRGIQVNISKDVWMSYKVQSDSIKAKVFTWIPLYNRHSNIVVYIPCMQIWK